MTKLSKIEAYAVKWNIDYWDAYALLAIIGADYLDGCAKGGHRAAERLGPEGRRARSAKGGRAATGKLREAYTAWRLKTAPFRVDPDLHPALKALAAELVGDIKRKRKQSSKKPSV